MDKILECLEQAQAHLLAHAGNNLAKNPDLVTEILSVRNQIGALSNAVRSIAESALPMPAPQEPASGTDSSKSSK